MNCCSGSQLCKGWKQWWRIQTRKQGLESLSSDESISPQKRWIWDSLAQKQRFLLWQNYFPGAIVRALAQLCSCAAGECSEYSLLAVILNFLHALLIWDYCPKSLRSSLLKGLWITGSSWSGCSALCSGKDWDITWNLQSLLHFTSLFTLFRHPGRQVLTEEALTNTNASTPV